MKLLYYFDKKIEGSFTALKAKKNNMDITYIVVSGKCYRVTQPNFDHPVDSTISIHFILSKIDLWYKMYGGIRI